MRILVPLTYNNYASRVIKWQGNTVADYSSYECGDPTKPLNFVPGDGIHTTAIINSNTYTMTTEPDYMLVADLNGNIVSRWFVMGVKRTTNGQYLISLRRDLLIDYGYAVFNGDPAYIRRGHVQTSDPAIFNNEGMHFNQIKTSETLLKDYTNCPWLVAYISPDVSREHPVVGGAIEGFFEASYDSIEEYPFYQYFNKAVVQRNSSEIRFPIQWKGTDSYTTRGYIGLPLGSDVPSSGAYMMNGHPLGIFYFSGSAMDLVIPPTNSDRTYVQMLTLINDDPTMGRYSWKNNRLNVVSALNAGLGADCIVPEDSLTDSIKKENGRVIKVGSTLYKIKVESYYGRPTLDNLPDAAYNEANNINIDTSAVPSSTGFWLESKSLSSSWQKGDPLFPRKDVILVGNYYKLTYQEIVASPFKYNFNGKDVSNAQSPYGIICMPYADGIKRTSAEGNTQAHQLTKENRLKLMQALGTTSGLLYDIQILPYCPLTSYQVMFDSGTGLMMPRQGSNVETININEAKPTGDDSKDYYADDSGKPDKNRPNYANWNSGAYITCMFVASQANISFSIEQSISVSDIKGQSNFDRWRLCSPNFASTFEFNAAKFYKGQSPVIASFDVDMCCRPFSPYIHVNPHFNGLYGDNFHDARGLICSGDFSVDRISDAWETYQYNNKNWESSFNRQIDTLEFNRSWNRADTIINSAANGLSSAAIGSMTAMPVVGAIGGALAGVAQGVYNTIEADQQANRNIADTKAQFSYQNENVQAQPYSIQKVSAINSNNKYFPVLEYYTCTTEEKRNFLDYINYFGMTVNRVGPFRDYIVPGQNSFIQAKLLYPAPVKAPTDVWNAINQELSTGVYIYVERLQDLDDLAASGGKN